MFRFGDEPQVSSCRARDFQNRGELVEVLAVDDQQLVLVELHFQGNARVQHGDARAAVIQQQVFEVAQRAFQHGQVDVFAIQVVVAALLAVVAGFEHHVDFVSQRDRAGPGTGRTVSPSDAAAISTGISTPVSLSL